MDHAVESWLENGRHDWNRGGKDGPFHRSASHIEPSYRDGWNEGFFGGQYPELATNVQRPGPDAHPDRIRGWEAGREAGRAQRAHDDAARDAKDAGASRAQGTPSTGQVRLRLASGDLRVVVCAAIVYSNGVMLVGPRHLDATMQAQYIRLRVTDDEDKGAFGFLDQEGVFMDRYEALSVAGNAGQVRTKTPPADRLFSEDLY